MTPRDWRVDDLGGRLRIEGVLEISNPHPRMEIFVPELRVEPVLLGSSDPAGLEVKTRIIADHPDEETRADGYWAAYIVKGRKNHACPGLDRDHRPDPIRSGRQPRGWMPTG